MQAITVSPPVKGFTIVEVRYADQEVTP